MKVLLVTKKATKFITKRLVEEAQKRGHEVVHIYYEDLVISIGEGLVINAGEKTLAGGFGAVILRMAPSGAGVYYKDILARHFSDQSYVLNGDSYIKWPFLGKIMQNYLLSVSGVSIVQSDLYARYGLLSPEEYEYPIVVKKNFGRLGKDVLKIDQKRQLKMIIGKNTNQFLLQPFLKTGEDYRIIVLGGKALPRAMKKIAPEGKFVTNISQGGKAVGEALSDELRQTAERAAVVFETDFCGVDIMYNRDGKPFVFEINRSANFEGFEESTGINVAAETINLLERKAK